MDFSPPPPPPPPPLHSSSSPVFQFSPNSSSSSGSNFPILAVAIIGILATAFLLLSYYIFVTKCCHNWHRFDLHHSAADPPTVYFPTTAAPRGLDDSLIRLIPVIRFRKEAQENRGGGSEETECLECAVCLSEFKQGEKLRVIPNCCHGFHIDCIDVWLQTNANCPLCRTTISSNTLSSIDRILNFPRDNGAFVVIEIRDNNLDEPRLVTEDDRVTEHSINPPLKPEQGKQRRNGRGKIHHLSSMDDECVNIRNKDSVFHGVQQVRRSISMDLSSQRQLSLEIREVLEQSRIQRKAEMSSSSGEEESTCSSSCSNRGLRRSFFSFGSGRGGGSRNAQLPV